jgi:hypothetical protein
VPRSGPNKPDAGSPAATPEPEDEETP